MSIISMTDVDLYHKRVLIREDLNVPMENGVITSDARIKAAIPTLRAALDKKAKVIVLSHLGRPKSGAVDKAYSLRPVAEKLSYYLGQNVRLVTDYLEGISVDVGEVVLCENTRFLQGEQENDSILAKKMAALGEVFIMDAFATAHRKEASTYGILQFAKIACAGLLFAAEVAALESVTQNPQHPVLAIVGGSKVSTKLTVLEHLLGIVNHLIVGGGIANTFLQAAGYDIGQSLVEIDLIPVAQHLMKQAALQGKGILLPKDVVVAHEISSEAKPSIREVDDIMPQDIILDIGPRTIAAYTEVIQSAKTILWNGPVGVFEFEQFSKGTADIAKAISKSAAYSVAGGGDTLAALEKFNVLDKVSYASTAGGAFLEFIEGKKLPAIAILEQRARG